ncbi:MAG: histidine kinase [Sphingobium sp.]|nr:histidine kinase [Sphingobium sp.]
MRNDNIWPGDPALDTPPRRTLPRGEIVTVSLLLLVFWAMFQFVFYVFYALSQGATLNPATVLIQVAIFTARPIELLVVGCGATLCLLMYIGIASLRERSTIVQAMAALGATVAGAFAFTWIVRLSLDLFNEPQPEATMNAIVSDAMRWIAPFGVWMAAIMALIYHRQVREREARLAQVVVQAHEAQVRALRYQINPHFLHNTLSSIATLILDGRNEAAEAMVMRLSTFFRTSLAVDPFHDVTLADELALQKLYLDIELVRFEDSLGADFDVPDELRGALVPSLILQPLVENALKYGVHDAPQRTLLRIAARRDGDRLVLEACDNGPGSSTSEPGTGVGLANVRRRLRARFDEKATLEILASETGFLVRLAMPLRFTA